MPILIAIFLLSLVVFILQNPSSVLPRTTLYFDAAHYLETAKRMYETIQEAFVHGIKPQALDALAFYLMLDGPVLPGAAVILFALLHKIPDAGGWQAIVIMQCVFQALCAVFIYVISMRLTKSRNWSLFSSALWMIYPAAITSCNSYLTEPLACLLSVSSIYFVSDLASDEEDKLSYLRCFAAGICLALLLLLKPAFAPALATIGLFAFGAAFYTRDSLTKENSLSKRGLSSDSLTEQKNPADDGAGVAHNTEASSSSESESTKAFLHEEWRKSWSFSYTKSALVRVVLAGIGSLLVILPWLSFTYAARGTLNLMPSRRPVYNICTGLNVEGDGWGCYPTHPVALMYDDNEAPLPVLLSLVEENPGEIINLSLRKITRLWNLPWNDYRYKVLGLNYRTQALFHLLIVLLALSGILLLLAELFCKKSKWTFQEKVLLASLPIFVIGHLIYLPFEGISRYGFTALPCFMVAAVFLLQSLFKLKWGDSEGARSSPIWIRIWYFLIVLLLVFVCKFDLMPFFQMLVHNAIASACLIAMLRGSLFGVAAILLLQIYRRMHANTKSNLVLKSALVSCITLAFSISLAFAVSNREGLSWKSTLKNGDSLSRSIDLADKEKPSWALLMVDGDQHVPEAKLSVNGHQLELPVSLYQFDSSKYELEDWLNQFASLIRESPTFIRRWRAVPVPLDFLKEGNNELCVSAPSVGSATVYGDYLCRLSKGKRVLPSANEVSPGKFFNDSEDAFDSRIMQSSNSFPVPSSCKFVHNAKPNERDLSTQVGVQDGDCRIFLLLGYAHSIIPGASESASSEPIEKHVPLVSLSSGDAARAQFLIEVNPQKMHGSHLSVSIKGQCSSTSGSDFAVAGVLDKGDRLIASILPGTPQMFKASATLSPFAMKSEIPMQTLQGRTSLRIELQKASGGECVIQDLEIRVEAVNKPQFTGHSIKVF